MIKKRNDLLLQGGRHSVGELVKEHKMVWRRELLAEFYGFRDSE